MQLRGAPHTLERTFSAFRRLNNVSWTALVLETNKSLFVIWLKKMK